jgi:tetratricopeptide (TPR) repeat protein
MRRRATTFVLALSLFGAAAVAGTLVTTPPPDPALAKQRAEAFWAAAGKGPRDQQAIELLRRGDFAALEKELEGFQRDYEAGKSNEYVLFQASHAFVHANLQPDIERWSATHPHAWQALAARGSSRTASGYRVRGGKVISETLPAQLDAMEQQFDLAVPDLRAALAQRPRFLPAWARLIDIARMRGDDAGAEAALEAALRQDPNSFEVRDTYMDALEPRWGGSWEAMDAFAQQAQAHAAANPELVLLLGGSAADRAYDRVLAKDYRSAIELYTRSLQFGPRPGVLAARADAYAKLDQCREALADLDEALHYDPDVADWLVSHAWCLRQIGQQDAAMGDYARAIELAPDSSRIVLAYGRALYLGRRFPDAAVVYERFLATHPRDDQVLEQLGTLYYAPLRKLTQARDVLARAVVVAPGRASVWRTYGSVLRELADPQARPVFAHYLQLVDPKDPIESTLSGGIRQWLGPDAPPAAMPH